MEAELQWARFQFLFFWSAKNSKFIFEHTCTCILCICKISQYYTFTCGLQEKDKYTFFNGPFIFVIGPEICYFCTAYKSQHFSTKFNTFLRNTYKFSWYFFQIFLELLNTLFDFFQNTELTGARPPKIRTPYPTHFWVFGSLYGASSTCTTSSQIPS